MKGDDISDRLIDLSVRVIRVVEALPKTVVGRHVGGQLVRAGTSGGSNYEEARGAESKADFIHKLGISWKEVRESIYWLKVIQRAELISPALLAPLIDEGRQLSAILAKSITTLKENQADNR